MAKVDMIGRWVWTRRYSSDRSVFREGFCLLGDDGCRTQKFSGTTLDEIGRRKFEISSSQLGGLNSVIFLLFLDHEA
jgi:hypothetical protein